MQIIPLSEGAFTVDKTKSFVPFEKGVDDLQQRSAGSLLVEIQPFALITSEDVLVLDTGLGFETDGMLQIHKNLSLAGIHPGDVTKVLMSHLHKDHAGGMSRMNRQGIRELSFPRATYYIRRKELAYAFDKESSSYHTDKLALFRDSPQIVFLDEEVGTIDGYIRYELTGAHCPFHQVFRIVDGGEIVFFGGDVAPQLQQMKNRFVAKYDYDGKKSMELRQHWWKRGAEEGWTFLFYHDIKTPTYTGLSK